MLLGLNLKNFAIIDELSLEFGGRLNIITGETGAGKSIIVDAINLILGDKASADHIKSGREEAHIEALFDVSKNSIVRERLNNLGFEVKEGELVVKRVISRGGRGRVFINGSIATSSILEQVTEGLIDIFSQHEHQSLLKEEMHLVVLDEFAGLSGLRQKLEELYGSYSALYRELEEIGKELNDKNKREDFLRFQLNEIDSAFLRPGEEESLEEERKKLLNAERLFSLTNESYGILYENENSVLDVLKRIYSGIEKGLEYDVTLADIGGSLERCIVELREIAFALRDYAMGIYHDPDKLSMIEARLQEIKRLKKKYGATVEEILEKRKAIESELKNLHKAEDRMKSIMEKIKEIEREVQKCAKELSEKRKKAAIKLSEAVMRELKEVGIEKGVFTVGFEQKGLSPTGVDRVTFLFSANPDEEPKPLTKVASGGELSRVMLVLKEVLARVEGSSVLVFDEADSGIGGAIAEAVGRKIKRLSQNYQVICITHLPQIAKFADRHFRVVKNFRSGKTEVKVESLEGEERVREIARMLSGFRVTEKTLEAAREMLGEG
ncbi:MAG: DNA repair protein RecN [Deltaproteobacteria bacterium]|nr:MAG: DNA repair protein RecN [Deltaproteobacteria bacterium]